MSDGDALEAALVEMSPLGPKLEVGAPLGPLTTYRVGGRAAALVTAASCRDLEVVAAAVERSGLPVLVVGRGSNLLVSDRGFPGIAVTLAAEGFGQIDIEGCDVEVGASQSLPVLARQSVEAGLSGLEWAVGVPGSVGGAVRMNAGGHGSDIAHALVSCVVFDLARRAPGPTERSLDEMDFSYRHSSVGESQVVLSARFRCVPGDPESGRQTIREIVRWRREHQPGGQNAGSVFTNPTGDSAGRVIDACGLKGRRWRTAVVSDKHANFIQADPGGSADDVYELIRLVRAEVLEREAVDLKPELRLVGFDTEPSTSGREFGGESGNGPERSEP